MARVTVEDCVLKVPNRFDLVMVAAQRAREISAGAQLTLERDNDKNPVVALRENDEPEEEGQGFGVGAGEDMLAEMQQAQISEEDAEDADMAIDGEFEDAAEAEGAED